MVLAAVLSSCVCPGEQANGGADGGVDAGFHSGCLFDCPTAGWADGGLKFDRAAIELLFGPTNCFLRYRISSGGFVIGAISNASGTRERVIALPDAGLSHVGPSVEVLLADETYVECSGVATECVRKRLDGGAVATVPMFRVQDMSTSGWAVGDDVGGAPLPALVLAPDGHRWGYEVAWGTLAAVNELGGAVGQGSARVA